MGFETLEPLLVGQWVNPDFAGAFKSHTTVAIVDTIDADGSFILHHFIDKQIKSDGRLLLVGLAQIQNHYVLVSRKRGINLNAYKEQSKFVFVDALTELLSMKTSTDKFCISSSPIQDPWLIKLLEGINDILCGSNVPTLIMIDDLTTLLYGGYSLEAVIMFVQRLKLAILAREGASLIFGIHGDSSLSDEGSEYDTFVRSILREADVILRTEKLGSGSSREVHGQLHICRGVRNLDTTFKSTLLQYKVVDNGATFFAKGFGKGVI